MEKHAFAFPWKIWNPDNKEQKVQLIIHMASWSATIDIKPALFDICHFTTVKFSI